MFIFSWIDDFGKLALICLPSFKLENFQTLWVFIWLIIFLISQYLANLSIQTYSYAIFRLGDWKMDKFEDSK